MSFLLVSFLRRRLVLGALGAMLHGGARGADSPLPAGGDPHGAAGARQDASTTAARQHEDPAGAGSPDASAGARLAFPRDFGSHPRLRTEWWYITAHASVRSGAQAGPLGLQITFFRARVEGTQALRSRFAARQLIFAHAAVTDVRGQRFRHDQRIAREGFGIASASEADTAIRLRDWSLLHRDGSYHAQLQAQDFAMQLRFTQTQPLLLQGDAGLSRKGPDPAQASFYYSEPQLALEGSIVLGGERLSVSGKGGRAANAGFHPPAGAAWLDHEWSDSLMPADAVGWDWIGMNLFDGSALMAFQMRGRDGQAIWEAGAWRSGAQAARLPEIVGRGAVTFQPLRRWKSPLTQASYPVEWKLRTPAGRFVVRALMDAQELDSRSSTGAVYWEGLSDLFDDAGRHLGRGYLEMTGYAQPLVL